MTHILAAGPGPFLILGHKIPVVLGQLLHVLARAYKIVMTAFIVLILWRTGIAATLLGIACLLILGVFVVPTLSTHINGSVAKINHGAAVGSTGASAGEVILLAVMLGLIIFFMMRKRGGGEEGE